MLNISVFVWHHLKVFQLRPWLHVRHLRRKVAAVVGEGDKRQRVDEEEVDAQGQ